MATSLSHPFCDPLRSGASDACALSACAADAEPGAGAAVADPGAGAADADPGSGAADAYDGARYRAAAGTAEPCAGSDQPGNARVLLNRLISCPSVAGSARLSHRLANPRSPAKEGERKYVMTAIVLTPLVIFSLHSVENFPAFKMWAKLAALHG
jgi:hypothetical protein